VLTGAVAPWSGAVLVVPGTAAAPARSRAPTGGSGQMLDSVRGRAPVVGASIPWADRLDHSDRPE
jgi:hypothetical protein